MSWHVAPLSPDDAAVLGPAHNRIWRAVYRGLLPDDVLDGRDDAESTRRWADPAHHHVAHGASVEGCVTSVAHDSDGTPVGWVGVGPARDDDPAADVELWALYVVPERWGAGVAEALVDACLPIGSAYLWVLAGNERAVAFYRKVGFDVDGGQKLFPGTAAVELRMVR